MELTTERRGGVPATRSVPTAEKRREDPVRGLLCREAIRLLWGNTLASVSWGTRDEREVPSVRCATLGRRAESSNEVLLEDDQEWYARNRHTAKILHQTKHHRKAPQHVEATKKTRSTDPHLSRIRLLRHNLKQPPASACIQSSSLVVVRISCRVYGPRSQASIMGCSSLVSSAQEYSARCQRHWGYNHAVHFILTLGVVFHAKTNQHYRGARWNDSGRNCFL